MGLKSPFLSSESRAKRPFREAAARTRSPPQGNDHRPVRQGFPEFRLLAGVKPPHPEGEVGKLVQFRKGGVQVGKGPGLVQSLLHLLLFLEFPVFPGRKGGDALADLQAQLFLPLPGEAAVLLRLGGKLQLQPGRGGLDPFQVVPDPQGRQFVPPRPRRGSGAPLPGPVFGGLPGALVPGKLALLLPFRVPDSGGEPVPFHGKVHQGPAAQVFQHPVHVPGQDGELHLFHLPGADHCFASRRENTSPPVMPKPIPSATLVRISSSYCLSLMKQNTVSREKGFR